MGIARFRLARVSDAMARWRLARLCDAVVWQSKAM
jgi:hypothetical protein